MRRAEPLRHDALAAELAGLPVDGFAVADVVLVERQAWTRPAHQLVAIWQKAAWLRPRAPRR
jgi:hypothetical protein